MKTRRQAKILELISAHDIETQEQMIELLREAGYEVTQATISRDIKELRITKEQNSFGIFRYVSGENVVASNFNDRLHTIFKECILNIDFAGNMVVIHTLPGLASAAASAIDAMRMAVVLGSIAGDDTVFLVLRDMNSAAAFCGEIRNVIR
jgi:transcriptional regulator of arginine metabolism